MTVRPLELLDLPTLYRYRDGVISLDTARLLTRGNPLGAASFMAYFNPARHIYTAIADGNGQPMVGGITHIRGETYARLLYLAPMGHLDDPSLPGLVEMLTVEAGKWGAFHVVAEVDERSDAFRSLRLAGFSVYAWQRIWDLSSLVVPKGKSSSWRRAQSVDLPAMQSLHHQIVPTLLHPVEPPPKRTLGLVCFNDDIRGYVSLSYGASGIVLTPVIHPEVNNPAEKILGLLNHLPDRRGRPVYLCVRSYQAWLEPVLDDLGALAGVRQAVMVKHLARAVKDEQSVAAVQPSTVGIQPSRINHIREQKSPHG